MGRLIAVSNRTAVGSGSRAGGLAVALWDAIAATDGLWFGWSGELVDEARGVRMITEDGVDFALADLTKPEHDGFYLGYANRALWPMFHYRADIAVFDEADFQVYDAVNRRLAQVLLNHARDGDAIWVHDYHFLLFGEALRQHGWNGRLGFFLHTPFPPPEILKVLPEHARLMRALAAFNVLGFQTQGDCENFIRYLEGEARDFQRSGPEIRAFGRTFHADAFPIGIDTDNFAGLADSPAAKASADRVNRFLGSRQLVIGVDRLDYSKGLPQRFEAMGRLLDNYTDLHGELSFTQIAPPSRSKVEAYIQLRSELDGLAGRINGDYGDLDWIPIRYLARSYPRDVLAGMFRLARVGVVTPLRDGMNLVAKEFIAAQEPDDPGVLVLSEFAGAAAQLKDALLVNPHDVNAVAEAVRNALQMPLTERQSRWRACLDIVRDHDVEAWRTRFLGVLNRKDETAGAV